MARVPYLGPDDVNDENREVLARGINLYNALGHVPGAAGIFSQMGLWLRFKSKLEPRLRELAILQVGYVERAAYEWAHHIELGYDFGVTDADIERLIRESNGETTDLDPLARHVLDAAREIARDGEMSDATWITLAQTFDTVEMLELTMAISFYCGLVRVLKTVQIDLEDSAKPFLEKYPLPAD